MRIELDLPPAPRKPQERRYLILKSWDALQVYLGERGVKKAQRRVRTVSPGKEYRVTIVGIDMTLFEEAFGLRPKTPKGAR